MRPRTGLLTRKEVADVGVEPTSSALQADAFTGLAYQPLGLSPRILHIPFNYFNFFIPFGNPVVETLGMFCEDL